MKKINLIEMLQGCSKRNGTTFRQSNPDGETTVKRQSRLMSRRGYLRNLAMIFAVLVMSMANVGMAWGVDYSSTPVISADFSGMSDGTPSAISGIAYNGASISSGKLTWGGNWSEGTRDIQLTFTISTTACKVVLGHVSNGSSKSIKGILYKDSKKISDFTSSAWALTNNATSSNKEFTSLAAGTYTLKLGAAGSSARSIITSIAIYPAEPSCTEITPSLNYTSPSLMVGEDSSSPTLSGNTGGGTVSYAVTSATPAGCITVNSTTGVVTAEAAGTGTVTATVAANGGYCEGSATANFTVTRDPVGEDHVITYIAQTGTGVSATLGTESKTSTSSYLTSLSNLTLNGLTITDAGKENSTPKIQTPASEDASKYLYLTFNVASGYQFTITQISTKLVAVTDAKTVKCEISDNNGGTTQSLSYSHAKDADPGTVHNFAFTSNNTYSGTVTVKLYVYGATSTYRLGKPLTITGDVEAKAAPSCTAPSSVGISGEWRYFPGQTISLTATPTGHTGTPTYQWQKEISADNWQNISNGTEAGVTISGATTNNLQITPCGTGNTGKYRCSVSTGATCSTNSDPFSVKIFTLNGAYDDGEFSSNNITFTSGTTGTATVHLAAGRVYKFKVTDNFGMWFGNSGRILEPAGNWTFPSNNSTNCVLFTGPEGDYTFTVDIDHVTYGTPEVVVSVAYPDVTHPSAGYAYFKNVDNWTNVGLYMWYEGGGSYTDWGSEPWVTRTTTICGNTYYYTPLIPSWYNRAIFREVGGSGQTGNIEYANLAAYSGKYNDKSDANWHEFTTYSITYAANDGGGSMSATSGICPDADQAITSNAFTAPTGCASFAHWTANVAVKVGGETVPTGNPIANEATIQNINSDITLTAVWKLAAPTITDNGDNTFSISGSMAGSSYYYTTDDGTPTTSSSLYSSAVDFSAGEANITAKAIAHKDGYVDSDVASQACTYHAPAEGCIDANSTNFGAGNSSGDASKTLADGTVVAMYKCTNSASSVSIGGNILFTAPTGKAFETFSFVATCGSASKTNYYKINGGSQQSLESSTTTAKTYTITIPGATNATTIQIIKNGTTPAVSSFCYTFKDICTAPTTAFANGSYTIGGSALDLSTLISSNNSSGAITYTVKKANGTGATIAGTSFTATSAGTATVTATQAANGGHCEKVMDATITVSAAATTYSVTHSLTNVTATSGATGAGAATEGVAYDAVFAANSGYVLPSTITVTIGGSPATVGTGYTWNASTGAFQVPAAQVTGAIVVTIAGDEIEGDGCDELVHTQAATATTLSTSVGTATVSNPSSQSANSKAIKLNSSGYVELSPKAGKSFAAGDSLIIVMWNQASSAKTTGYRIAGTDYTASMPSKVNTTFRRKLIAADIVSSKVKIERESDNGSNAYFVSAIIKHCEDLPSCTPPSLPTLSNQTVCPGSDIAAWDATPTNIATITGASEDVAYSWKKKGSDTEIEDDETLDLGSSATEGMAGTYVVTVTVSKTGYISKSASAEVDLTVTPATETPSVTASKATVYPGNSVTLTATCGSSGTITWAWYTCNSDGTGESAIDGATSNSYAIASAPAAGNHYYKVKATGDGTNACGTAEYVYTLTVSEASGTCNMMTIFDGSTMSSAPASTSGTESTSGATWTAVGTATEMSSTVSMEYSGKTYTKGWKFTGGATTSSSRYIQIVIPTGYTGDLVMNGFIGSTSRSVFVATSPTGTLNTSIAYWSPATTNTLATATTRLSAGTYYVCATNSAFLTELSVNVCGDEVCTDEKPTATATNNTVCSGSTLTITATGYESDPTSIQWQKKNGESWDNISGATSATYSVASAAAADAGTYRVQVTKGCTRNSNEVTITVPSAPVFGTVPASVTVMQTIALSISTVEATDAVKYRWYKSADATWDAGDAEICDTKNLLKAYEGEAIGNNAYYVFCRAQNSCGIATSSAIAINVIAFVSEDCAERGGEGEAQFGFDDGGCGQTSYSETACWTTSTRAKYLTYTAPEGKYLKTAKVTVAVSSGSKCGYAYSTDGGTTWTYKELTSLSSTLTEKTIELNSLSSTIDAFRIGRNLQDGSSKDWGVTSGNFYLSKACFEYTESCTATTVTPDETSKTYVMDGSSFTEPTFTVKHGGTAFDPQPTLTYSSSNEDIASVDDDGTVTFNGEAGTVTITAAYAGYATYCTSEGSYTINVSCPGGAPKVVASGSVDMSGCNSSVTLLAKTQADGDFADGTYQWFRNGEEIDGATSSSYTATQAGTYTVERTNTSDCTTPSTNSAIVTSETTEPEVERLVPFQYYHVDKTYTDQMKMRHLFAVKNSGTLDGKHFKMYVSRNGGAATDVTSSNALVVVPNGDGHVDTVMVDLNKLSGKYSENDELVFTCKAIDCEGNVSDVYKNTITMNVIGATPTLALILNGKDSKVGGDFLEDYEPKNLQEQTGSKAWSGEWPMYTDLKTEYNVTPVNGYAPFNKLNYEPFDIIFLTDFPKASKSDATKTLLDDMYELVDFRPMFSFKTHMLWKSPSKWASKGFTAEPVVPKGGDGRTKMNIVCYAHPMFEAISGSDGTETQRDASDPSQIVYKMLSGVGYENSKGIQGFEIEAAEHFVTIGLIHYNAGSTDGSPSVGQITWSPNAGDRMLVAAAERQANPEARMILLSLNAGAHSKLTAKGRLVVMKSLEYLIQTSGGLIEPADCSYTFDNGEGYSDYNASEYAAAGLHGTKGDGKWSTEANWGPGRNALPGQFTSVRIAAPVTVDMERAHVMETRIVEGGSIEIPAGKGLEVTSTVRHLDGAEISPTGVSELTLEASTTSNGTLIFNNNTGDSKATVWAYSKGFISEGVKNYQYIGTPFNELNALYNYYGSWIYSWSIKKNGNWGWVAVKNGGPMHAWTGYCISQESPTYYETSGTMTATGMVDIAVPAGENMVVGNSWTAPLYIKEFTDDDFENLVGNVYFFNTGVDKTGEGTTTVSATGDARWTGGTYVSIPIHASSYTGDSLISSMQGFFVKSNGSAGALHLDYDRHVRPSTNRNILSGPMHAPRRVQATDTDEPAVLKIKVSGENYDDKLLLLEREDFTTGFDNGWDGDKWDGNESALYIYTTDNNGTENSVSAIPEMEGTVIGFRAGEDDAYTLNFEYLNSSEPLYLYDVENNTYTQIMTGMTYRFFTTDNEKHERFIITRSNGQEVATGVESSSGSLNRSKAKKLLIEDKMFIMVNGMLYDATGKVVK